MSSNMILSYLLLILFISIVKSNKLYINSNCISTINKNSYSISSMSSDSNRDSNSDRCILKSKKRIRSNRIYIRGGNVDVDNSNSSNSTNSNSNNDGNAGQGTCTILISTSVGSSFLDKKKKLTINRNTTIADLKLQVQLKFPGNPPISLQKLFYGVKSLKDDDTISNISNATQVPILLDMLSGTSAYNKTMSITQALEAYASVIVHQAYIGDKMKSQYALLSSSIESSSDIIDNINISRNNINADIMETAIYREMFDSVKKSLYDTYAEDILQALEDEKEPESVTSDTVAWRGEKEEIGPLNELLAKQFDMNFKSIKAFTYYSILLGIFAYFGTNTSLSSQFLILMVPLLWVSKLRQLRLAFKLLQNLALPIISKMDFFMPLLPASLQVIAIELANIDSPIRVVKTFEKKRKLHDEVVEEEEDDDEVMEEDNDNEEEEENDDNDDNADDDDDDDDIDDE